MLIAAAAAQSGPWPTDTAFFPHYVSRRVSVLNGTWAFGYADASVDAAAVAYADITTSNTTDVPSCMDIAAPGIKG